MTAATAPPRNVARSLGAVLGAIVAITMVDVGPAWYPIALVLTTLPCAWLGGALHRAGPVTSGRT